MEGRSSFFKPGGTLEPGAQSYISREADIRLLAALLSGEYVFLLDSRQKGKSSLVARTLSRLKEKDVRAVKLDLQRIGANVDPEQWYAGLLLGIGQELGLQEKLFQYWEARKSLGPLARWIGALEEVVLPNVREPIVIFVDEIDFVRALSFSTDEFFAGIRDCYNRRSEGEAFHRLTFCLVGVATPGQLIRNPDISPFNIGVRIELTDFTPQETEGFAHALNCGGRDGAKLLNRVHYWVAGHPYLTQLICSRIAADPSILGEFGVDRLVRETLLSPESRQREPNLADVERRLLDPDVPGMEPDERRTQVLELYGRMLRSRRVEAVEQNPVVATLRLSGVGKEENGALQVRNRVYRATFDERWRRQNLPEAEARRQRGAARKAVLRTALVSGALIVSLSAGAGEMYRLSNERQIAIANLRARGTELEQLSSDRQTALEELERKTRELERNSSELRATSAGRQAALDRLRAATGKVGEVSEQRRQALSKLERQSEALKVAAHQRERDLSALQAQYGETQRRVYIGQMSSLRQAIAAERWSLAANLHRQAASSPYRGWEWGHTALLLGGFERSFQLPDQSMIERMPDGSLLAVSSEAEYSVTTTGIALRRKFPPRKYQPVIRRGRLRVGWDMTTWIHVIREVETDKVQMEVKNWMMVADVDEVNGRVLLKPNPPGRHPGLAYELLNLDGSVIERVEGPAALQVQFMNAGEMLSVDWSGNLAKRNAKGAITHTAKVGRYLQAYRTKAWFICLDVGKRNFEIRRVSDLAVTFTFPAPAAGINVTSISMDGERLLAGFEDGHVRRYDLRTGELLNKFLAHTSMIRTLNSLGADRIVTGDVYGEFRIWSTTPPSAVQSYVDQGVPNDFAWLSESGRNLFAVTKAGGLRSRNLATGKVAEHAVAGIKLSTNFEGQGGRFYIGLPNGRLEQRSEDGFRLLQAVKVFDTPVSDVKAMGKKRLLLQSNPPPGNKTTHYAVFDTKAFRVVSRRTFVWPQPGMSPPDLAWNEAGTRYAVSTCEYSPPPALTGQKHGTIYLVDADSGALLATHAAQDSVYDIEMTPDGKSLIQMSQGTASSYQTVLIVHDGETLAPLRRLTPPGLGMNLDEIRLSPNGRYLVGVRSYMTDLLLWDLQTGRKFARLDLGGILTDYAFSPDGARLIASVQGRSTAIWDVPTGQEIYGLKTTPLEGAGPDPADGDQSSCYSPDGRNVVTTSPDGVIRIWSSLLWKDQPKAARKKGS